jgi:hypothetical protein
MAKPAANLISFNFDLKTATLRGRRAHRAGLQGTAAKALTRRSLKTQTSTGDTMAKTKIIRKKRVIENTGVQRPGWEQVGRYMYYFGQLELALGDLLHRSLGLSKRAATLLLPRVMYMAKLDLIEAIIPVLKQPDNWKSKARRIVDECRNFNNERNMFCHGAFSRDAAGFVRFDYVSMKGKPPAVASWSKAHFDKRCNELERLESEVSSLYPGFRPAHYILGVAKSK